MANRKACIYWLHICLTTLLTLYNVQIGYNAWRASEALQEIVSLIFPAEIIISAIWAILFAFVTLRLAQNKENALRYSGWLIVSFVIYSLIRLMLFTRADYDVQRVPILVIFVAVGSLLFLLIRRWRGGHN